MQLITEASMLACENLILKGTLLLGQERIIKWPCIVIFSYAGKSGHTDVAGMDVHTNPRSRIRNEWD